MAHTTTTTNPAHARPGLRAPAGERLTFADFDGVSLWCTYTADDDQVILANVWVNGEWVEALQLFGWAQYDNWCNAVEVAVHGDADALAVELAVERAILAHQVRTGVFS